MQTSTIMTIGTALDRAMTADLPVTLLIGSHTLSGKVVQYDGTGCVLNQTMPYGSDELLTVVRVEAINAVTFRQ